MILTLTKVRNILTNMKKLQEILNIWDNIINRNANRYLKKSKNNVEKNRKKLLLNYKMFINFILS